MELVRCSSSVRGRGGAPRRLGVGAGLTLLPTQTLTLTLTLSVTLTRTRTRTWTLTRTLTLTPTRCSTLPEKPFYMAFKLAGFTTFDGNFHA